jgi:hypothetical protein
MAIIQGKFLSITSDGQVFMKSENTTTKKKFKGNRKPPVIFWKVVSEMTGVYIWFLKFSNFLARLVQ